MMRIILVGDDEPIRWLADNLKKADPDTQTLFHVSEQELSSFSAADIMITSGRPDTRAVRNCLTEDGVLVLLTGQDSSFSEETSVSVPRLLKLRPEPETNSAVFYSTGTDSAVNRAKQYLSIRLLRAGVQLRGESPASHASASPAPRPAAAIVRSWAEMLLPACELGLPCDDCGRCH